MELASYIDASTGYLRKGVDYEEFYNVYTSALDYLDGHPNYSGDGWTSVGLKQVCILFKNLQNY